jgi:hypothetical protein
MKVDPLQLNSVFKNPRYRRIKRFMLKQLAKLAPCVGPACNLEIAKPSKPLPKAKPKKKGAKKP